MTSDHMKYLKQRKKIYYKKNNKKFLGKVDTLKNLNIKNGLILPIYDFNVKDYLKNQEKILKNIKKKFNDRIVIRSSSANEDQKKFSNAGKYDSVLNINVKEIKDVKKGIKLVINSFEKKNINKNKIFIQKHLKNVEYSGVLTTCDISNYYSPYYIINFSKGRKTNLITGGISSGNTICIYKYKKIKNKFSKLIKLAKELENIFKNNYLDIEFAVSKSKKVYLFQVRPINKDQKIKSITKEKYNKLLFKLEKKIKKLKVKNHNLYGNTTYFGVMPDWNPAEIIGTKPNPLSLSLYKELITDRIWATNRKDYGFKDISNNQLMTTFFGTPFIDIRVDFNSWIPQNLNDRISNKMVNYYLKKFEKNQTFHDKIEFEILFTCFSLLTSRKIKKLKKIGFSNSELNQIIKGLKNINKKILINSKKNIPLINILERKHFEIINSNMYYIDKIHWLIEDCKKYGTYAFVGAARAGFVAVEFLNDFVKEKVISSKEKENFLNSLQTITSEMLIDKSKLSKTSFIKKYGHLRPDTYDINSLNYKDGYDSYFNKANKDSNLKFTKRIYFKNKNKIEQFIKMSNLRISYTQFIKFLSESIKNREYVKFVFTKNINSILEIIKFLGKRHKINIKDLGYISINCLQKLYYSLSTENVRDIIIQNINENKKEFKNTQKIKLPDVIKTQNDLYFFSETKNKINFIGNKTVTGELYFLSDFKKNNLRGKIILTEKADPGYDFIFDHKIKGLITKYGGANSHMAIRCAELKIPAAIGIGNKLFKTSDRQKIMLDCIAKKITLI